MDGPNYFGASQFAGGAGFMPSPAAANDNQFGAEGKYKKGSGGNRMDTIRAITCHQVLKEAKAVDEDDSYILDNTPLANVTVVGRILDVQENSTRTLYRVDDGTATITMFMHNDDEMVGSRRRELVPNVYVRAYGNLRPQRATSSQGLPGQPQQQVEMHAFNIRPVVDFNEVTYHNLQAIFQHLHLLKGAPPAGGMGGPNPMPAATMPYGTTQAYGAPQQQMGGYAGGPGMQQQQQPGGMMMGGSATRTGDPTQDVLAVYNAPENRTRPQGLSFTEVEAQLRARGIHYTLAQIKEHVNFLSNEGHLYSTIDDQHYKSSEA